MIDIEKLQSRSGIIGNSESIREVLDLIAKVSPVDIAVLIYGESGTGKEMVAKAMHKFSKRSQDDMITVNCGAIPAGIIESELFGHKKGSFTGANEDRKGYFESAHKGTIFLDEIGETPLETQVKLLRVLEAGEFMRVGDSKTLYTDVRVIAATNKDLNELVKKNQFRQDLYFRLKTVQVDLPPLRNRIEDVSQLVERFALEFTRENDIAYRGFIPEAIRYMKNYDWPGNVRELKNFVESILVLQKGERITLKMVEDKLAVPQNIHNDNLPIIVNQSAEQAERELILRQLLLLRQDVGLIKETINNSKNLSVPASSDVTYFQNDDRDLPRDSMKVDADEQKLVRDDAIGDMSLEELEREAIIRTLNYFNNNRRKAAKSLGMSERTLYRKIHDYGLAKKNKS
ncbi:MAG: sigma-54 dependent transcriptional regulator, partial [Candidatus Marinimicrobia bacterium]|nr:sigma-54 dependent transcriptional regulator [Candidatus Neomarinimicrobiota bacterium]